MSNLKSDDARKRFDDSPMTYRRLTTQSVYRLAATIDEYMRDSDCFLQDGKTTYSAKRKPKIILNKDGSIKCAFITCNSFYFSKREAVSFNEDGFIGFAGWSDSTNIQPIIHAFIEWVDSESGANQ